MLPEPSDRVDYDPQKQRRSGRAEKKEKNFAEFLIPIGRRTFTGLPFGRRGFRFHAHLGRLEMKIHILNFYRPSRKKFLPHGIPAEIV